MLSRPGPPEGGWMARLEEARRSAPALPQRRSESTAPPPSMDTPPPLPEKPAHRLVARLESSAPHRPPAPETPPVEEIASAQIAVAPVVPVVPRRGWRDALWVTLLVGLVTAGIVAAYLSATEAPVPEARVDPELEAKRARAGRARQALERGLALTLEGPAKATAAIQAYEEALALAPELAAAERGLAIALTAKGDKAAAAEHYRRYLELKPDAKDAAEVRSILKAFEARRRR